MDKNWTFNKVCDCNRNSPTQELKSFLSKFHWHFDLFFLFKNPRIFLPFWQTLIVVLQNKPLERSQGWLFSSQLWPSCWGQTRQHGQSGLGVLMHSISKSVLWQGVPDWHSQPKFWALERLKISSSVHRHFILVLSLLTTLLQFNTSHLKCSEKIDVFPRVLLQVVWNRGSAKPPSGSGGNHFQLYRGFTLTSVGLAAKTRTGSTG